MTVTIHQGDCIEVMKRLPSDSIDCCVTSPPYWGLRDYGVAGQIGMEKTLIEHLEVMVNVFYEVRRILKPTGTLWLNYGDCYASTPNGRKAADIVNDDRSFRDKPFSTIGGVLKPKDLCMIPNRLAIALQEAGWWVRAECIWGKPNPMPESVHDRPATAHEKVFLLSKSARYYYNTDAVRQNRLQDENANGFLGEPYNGRGPAKKESKENYKVPLGWDTGKGSHGSFHREGRSKPEKQRGHGRRHDGFNDRWDHMSKEEQQANGRNLRNYEPAPLQVWEIATKPFREAHFATFPPELVERCLKAGCPAGGTVLDPFGGAGTTGLVADSMGLNAILIELSRDYNEISLKRIKNDNPLLSQIKFIPD